MPTYEDPGCFCKFCCSPCAVYQAQGVVPGPCLGACCCGCWYTMFCWDPTAGKPEGGVQVQPSGAPAETDMER